METVEKKTVNWVYPKRIPNADANANTQTQHKKDEVERTNKTVLRMRR